MLFIAIFGAFVGFGMLLWSLQLYYDLNAALNGTGDLNKPQYLVINKEVNVLNTLFGGQKGFSNDEIAQLEKVKGVTKVAGLTSSHFKISLTMGPGQQDMMQGMYMELFFEAVPDEFIDAETDGGWQWHEGDSLIPIIIPREYVTLYNFGYAPTQDMPQVSESLFKLARANVTVRGPKGSATFKGRIAGFTERINTILAPQSFVDYANEKFGGVAPGKTLPNRVIVQCEGTATSELVSYFNDNGYKTTAESLRNSKLASFLRAVMGIVLVIGAVILLLAVNSFTLYSQLIIVRSEYELQTLIRIGYDYRQLRKRYMNYYAMIYGGILLLCVPLVWLGKSLVSGYFSGKGFDLPGGLQLQVFGCGIVLALICLGVNWISVTRNLKRLV